MGTTARTVVEVKAKRRAAAVKVAGEAEAAAAEIEAAQAESVGAKAVYKQRVQEQ